MGILSHLHRVLTTASFVAAAFLPAQLFACSIAPLSPPLPNESTDSYRVRTQNEVIARDNRIMREKAEEQTSWFDNARAIILYRTIETPFPEDEAYARKIARWKKSGSKGPPPPLKPVTFDFFGPQKTTLVPIETVRRLKTRASTLVTQNRLINTSCGPQPDGWLYGSPPGDIHLVFFGNDGGYTDRNIIWTVSRENATDPRIKSIFARWPETKREDGGPVSNER
jgi:hypothetical protein